MQQVDGRSQRFKKGLVALDYEVSGEGDAVASDEEKRGPSSTCARMCVDLAGREYRRILNKNGFANVTKIRLDDAEEWWRELFCKINTMTLKKAPVTAVRISCTNEGRFKM